MPLLATQRFIRGKRGEDAAPVSHAPNDAGGVEIAGSKDALAGRSVAGKALAEDRNVAGDDPAGRAPGIGSVQINPRPRIGKAGLIRFIQLSDSLLSTRICVFLPPVSV